MGFCLFFLNEVRKEMHLERDTSLKNVQFHHLKQELTPRCWNHLWVSWNLVTKLRNDLLCEMHQSEYPFYPAGSGWSEGDISTPAHFWSEGRWGREARVDYQPLHKLIFGPLCRNVWISFLVFQLPESSTIDLTMVRWWAVSISGLTVIQATAGEHLEDRCLVTRQMLLIFKHSVLFYVVVYINFFRGAEALHSPGMK